MRQFFVGFQSSKKSVLLGAAALAVLPLASSYAQSAVALPDSVVLAEPGVQVLGTADAAATVRFEVTLAMRNRAEFDRRASAGERVSAAELRQTYLPTQAAFDAVKTWLVDQGLTIEPETDGTNRMAIRASGRADMVGRALGLTFATVEVAGQRYTAAVAAPSIPASLMPIVASINGLQPYQHAFKLNEGKLNEAGKQNEAAGVGSAAKPAPAGGRETISGYFFPVALERAYKGSPQLTESGAGMRTAVLIDTYPYASDVTMFYKKAGIAQSNANIEGVQAVSGKLPAPSGEETIDVDMTSGIGYGSKVRVYATVDLTFTDLDAGLRAILTDLSNGVAIQQLSISLGACEETIASSEISTEETLFEQISTQGVTILVSSGDSGAKECGAKGGLHPAWFSTSPYVTAVGGTHLVVTTPSNTSPNLKIKTETAWTGSGGGVSGIFPLPSWQSQAGITTSGRAVPDVAAVADPATGVAIYLDGELEEYGGTSVAAPVWAGFIGWINQARLAAGKSTLGLLGPRIYPLLGSADFRDTVSGCNGGYCAGAGYDLVTGLGSPVLVNLLPALVAQP